MGSIPPGVPADTYGAIIESIASKQTIVVVDSVVGLE